MKYALLCLALVGCAEVTAPEPPDFARGCVYTDTTATPYGSVVMRGVYGATTNCAELWTAHPGNVAPR